MGVKCGRVKWTSGEWPLEDRGKRVAREVAEVPPTPLFGNKRLQVAENKGSEGEKERQERTRGGKPFTAKDLKT